MFCGSAFRFCWVHGEVKITLILDSASRFCPATFFSGSRFSILLHKKKFCFSFLKFCFPIQLAQEANLLLPVRFWFSILILDSARENNNLLLRFWFSLFDSGFARPIQILPSIVSDSAYTEPRVAFTLCFSILILDSDLEVQFTASHPFPNADHLITTNYRKHIKNRSTRRFSILVSRFWFSFLCNKYIKFPRGGSRFSFLVLVSDSHVYERLNRMDKCLELAQRVISVPGKVGE